MPKEINHQKEFKVRGGIRVGPAGGLHSDWPLGMLKANKDKIELRGFLIDPYTFSSNQISSFQIINRIPFLWWGIKIFHCVPDYPTQIRFWSPFVSPTRLIEGITSTGFVPTGKAAVLAESDRIKGDFIRLFLIVVISLLFLEQFWLTGSISLKKVVPPGILSGLLLFFTFLFSLILLRSHWVQKKVIKNDRKLPEIWPEIKLLRFLSGCLFLCFLGIRLIYSSILDSLIKTDGQLILFTRIALSSLSVFLVFLFWNTEKGTQEGLENQKKDPDFGYMPLRGRYIQLRLFWIIIFSVLAILAWVAPISLNQP